MHSVRALALVGVLGVSILATACSGQSGSTPPLAPTGADTTAVNAGSTVATQSTTAAAAITLVGQITYATFYGSSGSFQVKTTSGSLVWITTNSGTQFSYNGLTVKVGDWVSADGSYTKSTSFAATSLSLSATQPSSSTTDTTQSTGTQGYTLAGQVTYMKFFSSSGEFQVKTGSGALVWVYTGSSTQWTYNGLTLKVGEYAGVNGALSGSTIKASSVALSTTSPSSGSPTPAPGVTATPAATAAPLPAGNVPTHVQTAEYLETTTELNTSPSKYAPYLSWAYTTYGRMGMTQATGIKTVVYTSPMMPYTGTYEYKQLSGTYAGVKAQSCTGSTVTTYSGSGLLSDPRSSGAASYYQSVINNAVNALKASNPGYAKPWNLIYIDNAGPLYGASPTPCNFNTDTWSSAMDAALATTGQPLILNSLSVADSAVPQMVARLKAPNIVGGEFEECFMTALWSSEIDAQIQTVNLMKSKGEAPGGPGFWCYADNTNALGSSVIPQRLFIYASFLLSYDPNYSVFQESFTTPSTFKVFPETGFVPMSPVKQPAAYTDLQTSTGAYMQQYNQCYYRGSLIGKCEIVVNPSATSSVSVPNPWGLRHSMVLSGGGVLDGGTATFGGSVPMSMGPKSGVILVP
jgi:hypothetical protein